MTLQYSTAARNARGDALTTQIGSNGLLRWYSGTLPANPAAGIGGATLLAELPASATFAPACSNGVLTANAFTGANAVGSGTATFFRVYKSDGVTCVIQGTITQTGGGGDMTLDNTNIVSGQACTENSFVITGNGQ